MDTSASGGDFLSPEATVGYFGVGEGMAIADFGVGRGHYTLLLARIVGETGVVTGLDIMTDALDHLRGEAEAQGLKNINLVRANLEVPGGTGLPDNSQDFVLLANILFQSEKKEDIAREAHRVLKPGSNLALIDWRKSSGGVGPPDDLRTEESVMQTMVKAIGFDFVSPFNAGTYHYGMIFKKT